MLCLLCWNKLLHILRSIIPSPPEIIKAYRKLEHKFPVTAGSFGKDISGKRQCVLDSVVHRVILRVGQESRSCRGLPMNWRMLRLKKTVMPPYPNPASVIWINQTPFLRCKHHWKEQWVEGSIINTSVYIYSTCHCLDRRLCIVYSPEKKQYFWRRWREILEMITGKTEFRKPWKTQRAGV